MRRTYLTVFLALFAGLALASCAGAASVGQRTPIPTIIPATLPAPSGPGKLAAVDPATTCKVYAVDLIGAWVQAGASEEQPFEFTDAQGKTCQGVFAADVQFLFTQSNVWYSGALSCSTCHGPDLAVSYAMMNLSDYQGIMAGSRRTSHDAKGNDILAGGDWPNARLYQVFSTKWMPLGRPASLSEKGPLVLAGKPK